MQCIQVVMHHDKNFRKSTKTVGDVIGQYRPHGEFLSVRQQWSILSTKLGNFQECLNRNAW